MYLISFVGTNMVFKDGRYLVVRDVTNPNHTAYALERHCDTYQQPILNIYTANPLDQVVQGQRDGGIHLTLNI